MAKQIFKQFQQVVSGYTDFQNGILYFVRTSATREDGFLYFNGKKYGTAKDVEDALKKLLGGLPEGETSFASWIDKISTSLTIESAARIAGDNAIIGDSAATTTGQTTLYDLRRAVDSFSGSSHTHQNIDVLNGITSEKVNAWDAAEQNAKDYTNAAISGLDATVSAETNGVKVEIEEADGKLTSVTVNAPDFDSKYDEKGAAASAYTSAQTYTNAAISGLDATVSAISNGVSVEIAELDGKLTGVTVSAPNFGELYDEKGAAASAETRAKSYADGLIEDETERTESTYAKPADITSAISALSAASVSVSASETVASVSEANGVVSVTKQDIAISHTAVTDWNTELAKKQDALEFMTEPSSSNKVATAADIKDITGAMHFIGISSTDPTSGGPTIPGVTAYTAGDVCLWGAKEFIYAGNSPEQGWKEIGDEGLYVTKTTTIAGVDLQDDITAAELLDGIGVESGAQVNIIETVKVNGTALTVTNKAVDVVIEEGSSAGTISVNNVDVPVHGLGSMAFENAADFAAASSLTALSGSVESAITRLEGEIDTASAATYNAATANTASQIEALDATVTGASSGTTVVVTEADGVITNVSVENHISSDSDNALEMKSDGFFAAIYYEDNDPVA